MIPRGTPDSDIDTEENKEVENILKLPGSGGTLTFTRKVSESEREIPKVNSSGQLGPSKIFRYDMRYVINSYAIFVTSRLHEQSTYYIICNIFQISQQNTQ